jgi:hypothetical protein
VWQCDSGFLLYALRTALRDKTAMLGKNRRERRHPGNGKPPFCPCNLAGMPGFLPLNEMAWQCAKSVHLILKIYQQISPA